MVSKLTIIIHQEQLKNKIMALPTATFFVMTTFSLSKTYHALGEQDISNYNLTQSLQFAAAQLPDYQPFLDHYHKAMYLEQKTVKLSRI
jgi:hypothetical protein